MQISTRTKAAAAAAGCVIVGALAGIAGAAASTSSSSTKSGSSASSKAHGQRWFRFGERGFGLRGFGRGPMDGPAVHIQATVLDKAGTGFITLTEDNGTVQSVSGNQLTIKEAVGNVTYRTVTLTIPSGATVIRDFQRSALSSLHNGDRVRVAQSSDGTTVFAIDLSALPKRSGAPGHWWAPGGGPPDGGPPDGGPAGWSPPSSANSAPPAPPAGA